MKRRDFLLGLSSLPLLGFLRPKAVPLEIVCKAHEPVHAINPDKIDIRHCWFFSSELPEDKDVELTGPDMDSVWNRNSITDFKRRGVIH
jgi:hypothetical protein